MPLQTKTSAHFNAIAVCLGLSFALFAIYGQTASFDFVNWDDDAYVYANPRILQGLTSENVYRAFASSQGYLWHPVTTLTHLVDVELYGVKAGGHHISNVLIQVAAAVLLFVALKHLTGAFHESAFAAGLFALHPLRVESVAWVTERKDVLTGFFIALELLAYSYYVRKPSLVRYGVVGLAFVMGAMSKPSFITVPFVLLLLDYWPLRRDEQSSSKARTSEIWIRLTVEKIPFIALAAVVGVLTFLFQSPTAIQSLEQFSLGARILNAGHSYGIYVTQFFWPSNLAAFYAFERGSSAFWHGIVAWSLIVLISLCAAYFAKSFRYFAVGWFWYLGMLLPMAGFLQAGKQGHADRFTYLPQIGLAIAVTWGLADLLKRTTIPRGWIVVASLVVLGVLSIASWQQTKYWRNGVTLFTHAIDGQSPSEIVFNNLGVALQNQGREIESLEMYRRAVALNPEYAEAVINYGDTLRGMGQFDVAVPVLLQAMELQPDNSDVSNNLASVLIQQGRYDEAIERLETILEKHPEFALAHVNLGLSHFRVGKTEDAIVDYRTALAIDPSLPNAYANLAIALAHKGSTMEAIDAFRSSIRLRPNDAETLIGAAWLVATAPEVAKEANLEGLEWAKRGTGLTAGSNPKYLMILAASHAANQHFDEALAVAEKGANVAMQQGNRSIADAIRTHRERYLLGLPVR